MLHRQAKKLGIISAALLAVAVLIGSAAPPAGALGTVRVASGLTRPLYVTSPENDHRLFIVEQEGMIKILKLGEVLPAPFLDITDRVTNISGYDERGLLGLVFHPDYAQNGYFYVNYTDTSSNTVVARFEVTADPDVADPDSEEILLTIDQPFGNHNGGMMAFGPSDGYLYIGTGDGGSAGDPGNRAQDLGVLLGKILRIDVDGGFPYVIPSDNPFTGDPAARDEIWAYGLRNPWRWSFDRETADLWIADVGQSEWEEVDFQDAASDGGENYGWRLMEGNHCYDPPSDCNDGTLVLPIYEYAHQSGRCSISGGYVYRGSQIPSITGDYFFADWCTGEIWSLEYDGSQVGDFQDRTGELAPGGGLSIDNPTSFGQDAYGELYIVDGSTGDTGEVFKIVSDPSDVGDSSPGRSNLQIGPIIPNPFSHRTQFRISTPSGSPLDVAILDVAGRTVKRLRAIDGRDGALVLSWNGTDASGSLVPAGVYFVRAAAGAAGVSSRPVHIIR
ncbi:MAG: glucose dehydrogenase [Candidatus Eisenbacteria bacterium]|nr:glucose dehydrogenase [Candidatus Eisenbacteria bacterium]